MRPISLALLALAAGLTAGCASIARPVSNWVASDLGQVLPSGVIQHDTLAHEGTLSTPWMACQGGPGCSAQMRASEGGTRPVAVIYPPHGCRLTGAEISGASPNTVLTVPRGTTRPYLLTLEKDDLLRLAAGGRLTAMFSGCDGGEEAAPAEQTRQIVFDPAQLAEISARIETPFTEMAR
ncbi:MAG: hypothetical protein AAGF44_13445, partial [Pseudomonadota bacterium]